ncbi:MAG TPA: carbamate kinase [Thermoplasmata archaeon]|nr:carbamate kinase [Thermoplasmata archaeon]
MPAKQLVVAIGGNAIQPPGDGGTADAQRHRIEETAAKLADLVQSGHDLVVTHGNGPQVGNILLQNEEARDLVPAMPLDVCGAESQAQVGYLLAQALHNELAVRRVERGVVVLVTQTLVDGNDPAFKDPTKPIGPLYTRESDLIVKRAKGWKLVEDQARGGWRRVVPSPQPIDIIEKDTIRRLVRDGDGHVVICAGGGGIPVVRRGGRLVGVEAVIDKDLGAAVLARVLGWKVLLIATDVEKIALGFGRPTQRFLEHMTVAEAKKHLAEGQFPPGSMGPKVQAAIDFLETGGEVAVVTDLEHLADAADAKAGTRITNA